MSEIDKKRHYMVAKHNSLIQGFRTEKKPYTSTERKTLAYAISMIRPEDSQDTTYTFDIPTYCAVAGINYDVDNKTNRYKEIEKALLHLDRKNWWLDLNESGSQRMIARWFGKVKIDKDLRTVDFTFHESVFPYLQHLKKKGHFMQYELVNILCMDSTHAIALYELLHSYFHANKNETVKEFEIDDFRVQMGVAELKTYNHFGQLRKYVIEPAVEEINKYTMTMKVDWRVSRKGRGNKTLAIEFSVRRLTDDEAVEVYGQLSMLTQLD